MRLRSHTVFLLTPLLGAAVLASGAASANPDEERAAIIAVMQAWERAVETRDYDALDRYYARDAVYYPNGASPIVGRSAIINRNRQRGSDATVDITQHVDDVQIRGNWAIYSCLAEIRLQNANGRDSARYARVLLIMQKGPDGQWRILRDIDNDTPDLPPQ